MDTCFPQSACGSSSRDAASGKQCCRLQHCPQGQGVGGLALSKQAEPRCQSDDQQATALRVHKLGVRVAPFVSGCTVPGVAKFTWALGCAFPAASLLATTSMFRTLETGTSITMSARGGHYGQPKRQLFGTRAQTPPQSAVPATLTAASAHTALKPPSGPREARQAAVGVAGTTTKRGSLQNAPWLQQKSGGLRSCLRQPPRCISRSNYVCKAAKFGVLQHR